MEKLRKFLVVTILFTLFGTAAGAVSWAVVRAAAPKYTAETLIKVLPAPEVGPFDVPTFSGDQRLYRRGISAALLIKRQDMLEQLLTRDKIHETDWFARLGGTRDAALRDLKKNFGARAIRDSDLVLLSMTCSNPMDAALVVNEMVDAFLAQQGAATQGQITQRAARMSEQLAMLQRELDVAEQALDDVRRASGFIDLEERNLPEPVVERLIRLDSLADDLELGIAEARAWVQALTKRIADPNSENTPLQEARDELTALTARAEELKQLKDAAAKEKKDFDNARIQFERRAAIRDERLARVNQTKAAIETLRAAQQDPETPQLQFVARAPEPIEISSPRLRRYVPTGAAFGLVVGLIFGALSVLAPVKRRGHIAPL